MNTFRMILRALDQNPGVRKVRNGESC